MAPIRNFAFFLSRRSRWRRRKALSEALFYLKSVPIRVIRGFFFRVLAILAILARGHFSMLDTGCWILRPWSIAG